MALSSKPVEGAWKPLVVSCRPNGKPFMAKRQTFLSKHNDPSVRCIDGRDDQGELSTGPLQARGSSVNYCRISTVTRYTTEICAPRHGDRRQNAHCHGR